MPYSKEARNHALLSGGVPLDVHPGDLPRLFKGFVELKWPLPETLCFLFPERRDRYLDEWCTRAEAEAWAWDEVRVMLDRLVSRGKPVPPRLARFAMVPRPPAGRGAGTKEGRDVRLAYLADGLMLEGLTEDEIWQVFSACFPNSRASDPRDSFRKLRAKRSAWLEAVDDGETRVEPCPGSDAHEVKAPLELPSDDDWVDPVATSRALFTRRCPPFVLLWHFWGEHCEEHVHTWCSLATERENAWVWDELRELLNWLVYWELTPPAPFRKFVRQSRPKNPRHRPHRGAKQLRAAVVAYKLEELGHPRREAEEMIVGALGESVRGVDEATVRRHLDEGREIIRDFLCCGSEDASLQWRVSMDAMETTMELRRFESDRYYKPADPELSIFGTPGTLAQRRHRGEGPRYVRFGNRVLYRGSDLNEFLDEHVVGPGPLGAPRETASAALRSASAN